MEMGYEVRLEMQRGWEREALAAFEAACAERKAWLDRKRDLEIREAFGLDDWALGGWVA